MGVRQARPRQEASPRVALACRASPSHRCVASLPRPGSCDSFHSVPFCWRCAWTLCYDETLCYDDSMHSLPFAVSSAAGCRLPCSFARVALVDSRAHARLPGLTKHPVVLKWLMGLWLMGLIRLSPSSGTTASPNWPIAGPPPHLCPHYALPSPNPCPRAASVSRSASTHAA